MSREPGLCERTQQHVRVGDGFPIPPDDCVAESSKPILTLLLGQDDLAGAAALKKLVVEVLGIAVELPDDAESGPEEVRSRNKALMVVEGMLKDRGGETQDVRACCGRRRL